MRKYGASIVVFDYLLLLVGVVVFALVLEPEISSDGSVRFSVVEAIVNNIAIPPIKYSLVQPFVSLPIAFFAKIINVDIHRAVAYFNFFVFCFLGWVILRFTRYKYSDAVAAKVFLVVLSASMLPHHLQLYFGEVFSAFAIVAGICLIERQKYFSFFLLGVGIANTPVLLVPLGVMALILIRSRPVVFYGVVLALILIFLENKLKFGSLLGSSYLSPNEKGFKTILPYSGIPGFAYPVLFGALSTMLSFGKGLVFFVPGLLFCLDRDVSRRFEVDRLFGVALVTATAVMILTYSKWWAWYGGNFWGPRFFLILIFPAAIALVLRLLTVDGLFSTCCCLVVLWLSGWVGINGVVFGQHDMGMCWADDYRYEFLCWYVPEFSALWRPFVTFDVAGFFDYIATSRYLLFVIWQVFVCFYLTLVLVSGCVKRNSEKYSVALKPEIAND